MARRWKQGRGSAWQGARLGSPRPSLSTRGYAERTQLENWPGPAGSARDKDTSWEFPRPATRPAPSLREDSHWRCAETRDQHHETHFSDQGTETPERGRVASGSPEITTPTRERPLCAGTARRFHQTLQFHHQPCSDGQTEARSVCTPRGSGASKVTSQRGNRGQPRTSGFRPKLPSAGAGGSQEGSPRGGDAARNPRPAQTGLSQPRVATTSQGGGAVTGKPGRGGTAGRTHLPRPTFGAYTSGNGAGSSSPGRTRRPSTSATCDSTRGTTAHAALDSTAGERARGPLSAHVRP